MHRATPLPRTTFATLLVATGLILAACGDESRTASPASERLSLPEQFTPESNRIVTGALDPQNCKPSPRRIFRTSSACSRATSTRTSTRQERPRHWASNITTDASPAPTISTATRRYGWTTYCVRSAMRRQYYTAPPATVWVR